MKKLLTILTLALALCLVCGAALAIDYPDGIVENYADLKVGDTVKGKTITMIPAVDATKYAHGETVRLQVTCGTEFVEVVFKNVHAYKTTPDATLSTASTCTEAGELVYKCNVKGCNEVKKEKAGLASHTWVRKNTTEPTCTAAGESKMVCSVCNKVDEASKQTVAALGHDYKDTVTLVPKCKADQTIAKGKHADVCSRCKDKKNEKDLTLATYIATPAYNPPKNYDGHNWDEWVDKAATCLNPAGKEHWCKDCALHVFVANVGAKPLAAEFVYDSGDCKTGKVTFVCSACKGKAVIDAAMGVTMNHKQEVTTSTVVNNDAGKEIAKRFEIANEEGKKFYHDALHNYAEKDVTARTPAAPTCLVGQTNTVKCTICGFEVTDFPVVSALGHDFGEWIEVTKKDEKGTVTSRWERECKRCKTLEVKASTEKPIDPCKDSEHTEAKMVYKAGEEAKLKCGVEVEVVKVCSICKTEKKFKVTADHVYVVKSETPATCIKDGEKLEICSRCNMSKTTVLKKEDAAHVPGEPVITPATTEKEGSKVVKCTVCGEVLSTEVLPKELGETEFTSTYKFDTDTMTLAGKATQKADTKPADKVFARVTYFLADGTFIAVSVPVEEDGTFESMCTSPLAHVSVRIVDSAKVRPGEYNYLDK